MLLVRKGEGVSEKPWRAVPVGFLTGPKAESDLHDLGALSFPVISRGREFVCTQSMDDVAKFLGRDVKFERLSPPELTNRRFYFCDMALELIDKIPQQYPLSLSLPMPNRNRTVRNLSYHIFQVPEAFL
jgi:hypothetical protein